MNGMHANGSKATGFKSMVVAQFTGLSLQKDDRAFVRYNQSTGNYDVATAGDGAHLDGFAEYRKDGVTNTLSVVTIPLFKRCLFSLWDIKDISLLRVVGICQLLTPTLTLVTLL